ncbi:MAG: DUF2911 domain-containing protein [Flavobacteriaceae bacterium]
MKKLLLAIFCLGTIGVSQAQIQTPQPSPAAKVEQKVGLTDVTLEYSRPGVKGRTIFGDLVPFGKLWRTGANANTKITFSDDVKIAETELKAGSYAIYTKPEASAWDVYFYNDTNNWGTPQKWDDTKVAAKVSVNTTKMSSSTESFTIAIDDLKNDSAVITIAWDKTSVAIPFTVPTDKKAVASIEKVMAGASAGDYFSAARYYLEGDKDINKAKTWIDKAVDMTKDKPRFWYLRQQSLIYAKAGLKQDALSIAKKSMMLAEKAGNADYVKMNKDSIKEWSK